MTIGTAKLSVIMYKAAKGPPLMICNSNKTILSMNASPLLKKLTGLVIYQILHLIRGLESNLIITYFVCSTANNKVE